MATEGTVGDLIEKSLGLAQLDLSLAPVARGFYNDILRKWSKDLKLPYYGKEAEVETFVDGQKSYDLPEDYNRSDECWIWNNNQQAQQVFILTNDRFRQFASGNIVGVPRYATIDQGQAQIKFQSAPSGGSYGYKLSYFRQAELIDVDGGNDGDTPDFDDFETLKQELTSHLMKWADDERQGRQAGEAKEALRQTRFVAVDADDDSVVELAPSKFRAGVRPSRGGNSGNSGGWMGP